MNTPPKPTPSRRGLLSSLVLSWSDNAPASLVKEPAGVSGVPQTYSPCRPCRGSRSTRTNSPRHPATTRHPKHHPTFTKAGLHVPRGGGSHFTQHHADAHPASTPASHRVRIGLARPLSRRGSCVAWGGAHSSSLTPLVRASTRRAHHPIPSTQRTPRFTETRPHRPGTPRQPAGPRHPDPGRVRKKRGLSRGAGAHCCAARETTEARRTQRSR